jgi:hypothetical protein
MQCLRFPYVTVISSRPTAECGAQRGRHDIDTSRSGRTQGLLVVSQQPAALLLQPLLQRRPELALQGLLSGGRLAQSLLGRQRACLRWFPIA